MTFAVCGFELVVWRFGLQFSFMVCILCIVVYLIGCGVMCCFAAVLIMLLILLLLVVFIIYGW